MRSGDILYQLQHHGKLIFRVPKGHYFSEPVTYCIRLNQQGDAFTHSWWSTCGSSWGPHVEGVEATMKAVSRNLRYYEPPSQQ